MTPKWDLERRPPPTARERVNAFLTAGISTAIPFVVLFILTTAMVGKGGELVWMGSLALCVVALLVGAGFAIADKRRIALGILAGVAVGLVGLVVSCSVVLAAPAA